MIGRGKYALTWRDLAFVVAPLATVVVYTFGGAVWEYMLLREADDSMPYELAPLVERRIDASRRVFEAHEREVALDPENADRTSLKLYVPHRTWRTLHVDPIAALDRWVDATAQTDGALVPVEVRPRGDRGIHWIGGRMSLAVKLPKRRRLLGLQRLNLSKKRVLEQYTIHRLQKEVGLLAPQTMIVPVFVNGRFYGLFRGFESTDETFLRREGRMPGNVYRVDAIFRGEYFPGIPSNGFRSTHMWDRTARNDRPMIEQRQTILDWLTELNTPVPEAHRAMMDRFDVAEIGRYLAFFLLVGDPFHTDVRHNQFWYEDPSAGTLHPIPVDMLLGRLESLRDLPSDLLNRFVEDPAIVLATLDALRQMLDDGVPDLAGRLARDAAERYASYFAFEALLPRDDPTDEDRGPEEIASIFADNASYMRRWIDDRHARVAAFGENLDIVVAGRGAVELTGLELDGECADLEIRRDRGDTAPIDRQIEADRAIFEAPERLAPAWIGSLEAFSPVTRRYRYRVTSSSTTCRFQPILPATRVDQIAEGTPIEDAARFHPWDEPTPRRDTIRLEGDVVLDETLRIGAEQTLIIAAGAHLRLGPDVSIISRGRLTVAGRPDAPVRIEAADPTRPFGTLALFGPGAAGSEIRHATILHGGGALADRVEWIGMVNVHGVNGVRFDHVTFEENLRSDDALHALHAEVTVSDCRFLRANSDAIDFDQSGGAIVRTRIEGSRNDAIDLMTSSPRIEDNVLIRSGDKGISIGEASHPLVIGNEIRSAARGVEVKDGSEPWLVQNRIVDCGVGIAGKAKNWRYGGVARPKTVNDVITDTQMPISMTAASISRPFDEATASRLAASVRSIRNVWRPLDPLASNPGLRVVRGEARISTSRNAVTVAVEQGRAIVEHRFEPPLPAIASTVFVESRVVGAKRAVLTFRTPERAIRLDLGTEDPPARWTIRSAELPNESIVAFSIEITATGALERNPSDGTLLGRRRARVHLGRLTIDTGARDHSPGR